MTVKKQLISINNLLTDVYQQDTRISDLLCSYLQPEQLSLLKADKLEGFLKLFLYGLQCRFAYSANGLRTYNIIYALYGLDGSDPRTLESISKDEDESRERIIQLQEKALRNLTPFSGYDSMRNIAYLAASQVLDLEFQLPINQQTEDVTLPSVTDKQTSASYPIEDEAITITAVINNIHSAMDTKRGDAGYIMLNTLRGWLLDNGYLKMVETNEGSRNSRPTELGKKIGIDVVERESRDKTYFATVYNKQAQIFIRDNITAIAEYTPQLPNDKKQHNQNIRWTPEMDYILKLGFSNGMNAQTLASALGRSVSSINERLKLHDLID